MLVPLLSHHRDMVNRNLVTSPSGCPNSLNREEKSFTRGNNGKTFGSPERRPPATKRRMVGLTRHQAAQASCIPVSRIVSAETGRLDAAMDAAGK